jgi:hypothetical protein
MRFLVLLLVLALVAFAVWMWLSSRSKPALVPRWQVTTRTRDDGTLVVAVSGADGERVVRELPPALEGVELTSELRLAREEAQLQADELNR